MKKFFITSLFSLLAIILFAQNDSTSFKGYYFNSEYNVYITMNLYEKNINVPAHELFGELPGYLGKKNNSFYWLITNGDIESPTKAKLDIINDFGSEDLKATFLKKDDKTFVLKQIDGSQLKVPNNRKWQKLPKELIFTKQ